ncbi:hypothetical protein OPT61_g4270 [Boeremia exigua]|uniref:Uncharacterized protein n=1 Tax=Boeremia exigua TaxID=749465 RepID=A0ACC2IEV4_9PLEO|nr:hypothetical protein OPT61_g4270 [Boeremia exigua]
MRHSRRLYSTCSGLQPSPVKFALHRTILRLLLPQRRSRQRTRSAQKAGMTLRRGLRPVRKKFDLEQMLNQLKIGLLVEARNETARRQLRGPWFRSTSNTTLTVPSSPAELCESNARTSLGRYSLGRDYTPKPEYLAGFSASSIASAAEEHYFCAANTILEFSAILPTASIQGFASVGQRQTALNWGCDQEAI